MASRPASAPPPFEPGRLRDRVTIRRLTDTPTGKGGSERSWTTIASRISAEVIGQSGREQVIANTLQGIGSFRITIRHRPGIRAGDQLLWHRGAGQGGDLELNVLAPPNDATGRRQYLQIFADTSSPQNAG